VTEYHRIDLRFGPGAADATDLENEISSALAELADQATDPGALASSLGLNTMEFIGARVEVSKSAKGFGEIALLIAIVAPAATHALNKAWDDIIWPRVKSRLGADAVGPRQEDHSSSQHLSDSE
jgi:hypothetical protein